MIGRLSQRKAVQRLSGIGTAATAVAFAFALTGAGQLVGASLYADGTSSLVPFKLDTGGVALPANFKPSGFAVSPSGEWLAVNLYGSGVSNSATLRIFRRTGDKTFTAFASLYADNAEELRFVSNTAFVRSAISSYPGYYTFNGTTWAGTSYGNILQGSYDQTHGGLGISTDGLFRCLMGRFIGDDWNMGFCGVYNGVKLGAVDFGQTIGQYNVLKTLISPDSTKAVLIHDGSNTAAVKAFTRSGSSLAYTSNIQISTSGQPVFAAWLSNTQLLLALTEPNTYVANQAPPFGKLLRLQVVDISSNTIGTSTPVLNLSQIFSSSGNKVTDIMKLSGTLYGVVTDDFQFAVVSVVGMTVTFVGASAISFQKPYAAAFYRAS